MFLVYNVISQTQHLVLNDLYQDLNTQISALKRQLPRAGQQEGARLSHCAKHQPLVSKVAVQPNTFLSAGCKPWGNAYRHSLKTWQHVRSTCSNLSWSWRLPSDIQPVSRLRGLKPVLLHLREYPAPACGAVLSRVPSVHLLVLVSNQLIGCRREDLGEAKGASAGRWWILHILPLSKSGFKQRAANRHWCCFSPVPFGLQLLQHIKFVCRKQHLGLSLLRWVPQGPELHSFAFLNMIYYY